MNIFANSSASGNATKNTSEFIVYKELSEISASENLPLTLQTTNETILSFDCGVGDYRIATLNLGLNSSNETMFRVYVYNGVNWIDILHSQSLNTNSEIEEQPVSILASQIFPNSTNSCLAKVKNVGNNNLIIESASLKAYYDEKVKIHDLIAEVNGVKTT